MTRDAQVPVIQDVILPVKMGVKVHVHMVALTPVPEVVWDTVMVAVGA